MDPRPEGPRRLRRLLVPQGGRAPAVQLLGGRLDPRPLPRLWRPDLAPIALLPDLVANYEAWEKDHRDPGGLFWQIDDRDGMEYSIGGSGYRPSINSYMYGDAMAIAAIADLAGERKLAETYRRKAEAVRRVVEERLWDDAARFYKTVPRGERTRRSTCARRSASSPGTSACRAPARGRLAQLTDPNGFAAPFGPTTAERRHPRFNERHNHECLWNGPSWPYATTQTLVALANLLNQEGVTSPLDKKDYFALLMSYARAQHLTRPDGTVVPWIDENLDPDSGRWIARDILHTLGRPDKDRGRDYNHSGFCDLVVTGLVGLRPRADRVVEVNPLVPEGTWNSFCLDGVPYHGRQLTVLYDRDGRRYGRGAGLRMLVDGVEVAAAGRLGRLTAETPSGRSSRGAGCRRGKAGAADGRRRGGRGRRLAQIRQQPGPGGQPGDVFRRVALARGTDRSHVVLMAAEESGRAGRGGTASTGANPSSCSGRTLRPTGRRTSTAQSWSSGRTATTCGIPARRGHSWIGHATSLDGKTWTRTGKTPVLAPEAPWEKAAVMCPHVLWDKETKRYQMWYSGGEQYEPDAIGYPRRRRPVVDEARRQPDLPRRCGPGLGAAQGDGLPGRPPRRLVPDVLHRLP